MQDCISFLPNENLHVITSGRRAKNPLNLLLTDALSRRLLALSAEFEMIVVDSPPIELVSDVLLIGRTCSGLVYVVRSDSTEIPMIRRGLDRIRAADIRVLGVVLNAHNFTKASRYFGESSAQAKYDYSYGAEGSSANSGA